MKRKGNYNFLKQYTWYVPGIADLFILLLFLLVGVLLGNGISLLFNKVLGAETGMAYSMLLSYPVMFVPAMIYAGSSSRINKFRKVGLNLDNNHFGARGGVMCALLAAAGTIALSFCCDAFISVLPQMPQWLEDLLKSMVQGPIWANLICVSLFAPIFEEWLCRGMVLRGLLGNNHKPVVAIIVSALFFAVIHANPWQAIPAFLIGLLLGYVYYKTGSLKLTMLMHCVNNTLAVIISHIDSFKDADNWLDILPARTYWPMFAAFVIVIALVVLSFSRIPMQSKKGNLDTEDYQAL